MFTKTVTRDQHIEELRAELRVTTDLEEAAEIRAELSTLLGDARNVDQQGEV